MPSALSRVCVDRDGRAGEQVVDLPDPVRGDAGRRERVEQRLVRRLRSRSRGGSPFARTRPASPTNGRAITRETSCGATSSRARDLARRDTARRAGSTSSCAAIWKTESADV